MESEEDDAPEEHRECLCVLVRTRDCIQDRKAHTMRPRATSSYFQPRFLSKSQGAGNGSQEFLGINTMATRAESTAPKEKKTERAVTRYSFPWGICSRRSVPSVGREPFQASAGSRMKDGLENQAYPDSASKEKYSNTKHGKSCGQ